MRTRTKYTREQRVAAAKHLAAKREAYQRQVEEMRRKNAPLSIATIDQWTAGEWAEFERRFAPKSWRRS